MMNNLCELLQLHFALDSADESRFRHWFNLAIIRDHTATGDGK